MRDLFAVAKFLENTNQQIRQKQDYYELLLFDVLLVFNGTFSTNRLYRTI